MNRSYFVTATDTGVGKTVVSALIACALRARGVDAGVMKPFASGCRVEGGELRCEDAEFLRASAGVEDEIDLICPARWEEPLAPLVAARRAGNAGEPWLQRVEDALRELERRHECVVVEGVGGWMVPVCEDASGVFLAADFASRRNLRTVLVARRTLGTISHTLLSHQAMRARGLSVELVFCDAELAGEEDVAVQTSAQFLCEHLQVPLCHVPHTPELTPEKVRALAAAQDWEWLKRPAST